MYRGTTPTLRFTLPFDTSLLVEAWITLGQVGKEIINKTLSDCETSGKILSCELTQGDTLSLTTEVKTEIQLRVKTTDGKAFASKIFTESTRRILKDGVI